MGILCLDQIKISINHTDVTLLWHQITKLSRIRVIFTKKSCCSFGFFSKLPPPSPSPRFGQLVPLYLSTKNVNLSNIQNESSNYWHFGGNCSSCLGSEREFVWASADARRTGDSGYRVCQITCCNTATQENLLETFDKIFLCAIVKI